MKTLENLADAAIAAAYGYMASIQFNREFEIALAYGVCCVAYTIKLASTLASRNK